MGDAPGLIRPEDRYVEPLSKSGLDAVWRRVKLAIREKGLAAEHRFSLHALKRKAGTETAGDEGQRQDALGVSDPMMKTDDKSKPRVKPAGFTR